jgi:dynein light intermediate chain 2
MIFIIDLSIVFIGDKGVGKTSVINKFLEKGDNVQPSSALEYTYGKRSKKGSTTVKDIVHTWELAATDSMPQQQLASMLEITMGTQFIGNLAVVILVDLSKPARIFDQIITWLDAIRKRVEDILKELKLSEEDSRLETLRAKATQFLQDGHTDKASIRPIGIPIIIVGTKMDKFQDFEAYVINTTVTYTFLDQNVSTWFAPFVILHIPTTLLYFLLQRMMRHLLQG